MYRTPLISPLISLVCEDFRRYCECLIYLLKGSVTVLTSLSVIARKATARQSQCPERLLVFIKVWFFDAD